MNEELLRLRVPPAALPVGSRALPPWQRARLAAVYNFAALLRRAADEADCGASIDALEADFDRILARRRPLHPAVARLRRLVRHRLPTPPFRHLMTAARQDHARARYVDVADLFGYCQLAGGPLGVLTLHLQSRPVPPEAEEPVRRIYGAARMLVLCTQVRGDARRGRVYLPEAALGDAGVGADAVLSASTAGALRPAVEATSRYARDELDRAAPVLSRLPRTARLMVAGVVAEATVIARILDRIGYNPVTSNTDTRLAGRTLALARVLRTARRR